MDLELVVDDWGADELFGASHALDDSVLVEVRGTGDGLVAAVRGEEFQQRCA